MAAFVNAFGAVAPVSQMASVCGARVSVAPRAASTATIAMAMGTGNRNSSLESLGLDKVLSENVRAYDARAEPGFSAEYEEIISATYRQIFGNAYIMESERATMATLESMFRDGQLSLKDFCRALCKSEEYKKRFFTSRPLYGAIEMNFRHILGRTPDGLEQYRAKSAIYDAEGYEAFVDAFFDDGEYDNTFDEFTVPSGRGFKTEANLSMASFTHYFQLNRGQSTSDKSNPRALTNQIPLNYYGITSNPTRVGGLAGSMFSGRGGAGGSFKGGVSGLNAARVAFGVPATAKGQSFRVEVVGFSQGRANGGAPGVSVGSVYKVNKRSTYVRSNQSYIVGLEDLNRLYQRVTKNGGKIASVTPI